MKNIDTLLVIARKFNDIFYAVSTPVWHQSKHRILVIFAKIGFSELFPLKDKFDDVIIFDSSDKRSNNLHIIQEIYKTRKYVQCDAILVSNVVLVANQYLIKITKCQQIFLLEDGLMNYYDFRPSASLIKHLTQLILGIDEQKLFNRIRKTFLLSPKLAKYYRGELVQLQLTPQVLLIPDSLDIDGKKIFVGQCLYKFGYMSLPQYNIIVNRIIKQHDIDYYLPHPFASNEEHIDCPILNLNKSHITLEILASQFKFELYSFCSSVLYSTCIINPNIKNCLIRIPELFDKSELPVIKKYCSKIIDI